MKTEELKQYRWTYLAKPIKEKRICTICGRRKTFVYVWKAPSGGLWTKDIKPNLPYMRCPRCQNITMIEEDSK